MEKTKLILPASILIGVIILGGFYYVVQKNKQDSIDRQQKVEQQAKADQDKKDYTAKQKTACLDIYTTEGKKWTNVTEWYYNEFTDQCVISYKDSNKKTQAQCDKDYARYASTTLDTLKQIAFDDYINCSNGVFTKTF